MTFDLKQQCATKLQDEIAPNITGVDKVNACAELKISRTTLDKYLKGEVANIETALGIIEFLQGKVKDRLSRLNAA